MCAASVAACSTSFSATPCSKDKDCGTGYVCELVEQAPVCVKPADAPINIGQSAPVSGNQQALGTGMKLGIKLAFDEQNAAGGINGRQLNLVFRDDGYNALQAEANARMLVDVQTSTNVPKCPNTATPVSNGATPAVLVPVSTTALTRGPNAVLALVGDVGTPTAVRAAPVAIETGTVFFGPFTGAQALLRDMTAGPCAKYIFNVRASYIQEARATVELFIKRGVTDYKGLMSFDQSDTFGQAGYDGLKQAAVAEFGAFPATADPTNPITRVRYTKNDDPSVLKAVNDAETYLKAVLTSNTGNVTVGIMMTDTYGPGTTFIQQLRNWQFGAGADQTTYSMATRLSLHFSNVSFVGPDTLAKSLVALGSYTTPAGSKPFTDGVTVSQVVPNYQSDQSDVVTRFTKANAAAATTASFTSLEGYISARVFIGALLAIGGPVTPDSLVTALETLPDLGLGIGATSGYSPTNHQYSNSVWGTSILPDGTFQNLYYWTEGGTIQFF
jgi:ABC-type branched-subunit amino acid transport system substrate-binding protein